MNFMTSSSRGRVFANKSASLDSSDEDECKCKVLVVNNHIYFYEDISIDSIRMLTHKVKEVENQNIQMQMDYSLDTPPKIFVHIQSYGGDAYAGLSGMDTLKGCRVPVVTIVEGFVASAATFLLLGGKERWMQPHSNILIHQIRTEFWGRFDELKDEMLNSDNLMKMITSIYKENSKFPIRALNNIIKKEIHMDASECLKHGIVDKITS